MDMDMDNINDIIERDWNDAEMDAVARAEEETERRIDHLLNVVWNSVVAVLSLGLVVALCIAFCKCRELHATVRARAAAACPSGTAQRVVDEVNREPFVRVCNAVADVVLGK